ncbi:response regulator receiver domain [Enterobacter hormaechei]|uniref:response regulator receiver domain n=2 Tax=Enterobacter hormaechei TaxID=158836 RepID=UPI0028B53047|nr:response regulator receiver domain [Enterobacter hormaechei]MDT7030887.1 response regulator receiver domain [Enterobacter hormaechei]
MNTFTSLSERVTNDFIQNIIFIDDKAYSNGPTDQHEFDAQEVTKHFSKKGKICAVYKPIVEGDLDCLTSIAKKSDVTILDWQIVLNQDSTTNNDAQDDESDAEEDDVRGVYTKRIITSLLSDIDNANCVKLILIYTGEVDLNSIALEIERALVEKNIQGFEIKDSDPCSVVSNNCKIMVLSKSNGSTGRQHLPALAARIKRYDELPDFISSQFTEMTSGLLSNFAMESLSEIRRNFHHILTLFSKDLDAAYLAHQSLLPNALDANELLVQLLSDTFSSIIRYKNLNHFLDEGVVKLWLSKNIEEGEQSLYQKDGSIDNVRYIRNPDVLLSLLKSHPDVSKKYCDAILSPDGNAISKAKIELLMKKFAATLFTDINKIDAINKQFAKLCYHRSTIFSPGHLPFLSLGTVVKSTSDGGAYYICIQQRCDSVRIKDDESRRFLFISLEQVSDGGFNFLTPDGVKLKINKSTYSLRTVKFCGNQGVARAKISDNKKYFEPTYYSLPKHPERFEFIVELKELYAQQIVEEYSSSLSRVGLDEPEWVRRLS